jgi:hypothetical protein
MAMLFFFLVMRLPLPMPPASPGLSTSAGKRLGCAMPAPDEPGLARRRKDWTGLGKRSRPQGVEGFGMVIWAYTAILAWSVAMPASVVPPMPRPEQVMTVPPELRAQLQQQVIAAGGSERSRLERLVVFLFQKPGLGMEYSADATLTLDEAYRTRKANCLTFTR